MSQRDRIRTYNIPLASGKGTGPGSAGQSGDTQGLSDVAEAGSESVEELVQEGQSFEAALIAGIEDAPDADVAEVHVSGIREDEEPGEHPPSDSPRTGE